MLPAAAFFVSKCGTRNPHSDVEDNEYEPQPQLRKSQMRYVGRKANVTKNNG